MLREDYAEGAEVRMGNHRFICIVALGRGSYGEVWRAKVAVSLRQLAYCQKVLRNPFLQQPDPEQVSMPRANSKCIFHNFKFSVGSLVP